MGTLYVFFGSSGVGKSFLEDGFILYSKSHNSSDGTKKILEPVPRLHSRNKRQSEYSAVHRFSVSEDKIISNDNFYSAINGAWVGINKANLKERLASGQDLIFSTGSVDMIEQLTSDPDIKDNICLVYFNGPGYDKKGYFMLEMSRNQGRSLVEIAESAYARAKNSEKVSEFYNSNQSLFDYAYLNVMAKATNYAQEAFKSPFLDKFYQVLIDNSRQDGPCWIANKDKNRKRN